MAEHGGAWRSMAEHGGGWSIIHEWQSAHQAWSATLHTSRPHKQACAQERQTGPCARSLSESSFRIQQRLQHVEDTAATAACTRQQDI
jgi:hypothetical protein